MGVGSCEGLSITAAHLEILRKGLAIYALFPHYALSHSHRSSDGRGASLADEAIHFMKISNYLIF